MKRDRQSIPLPIGLEDRPKDDRGFPITFVTLVDSDGRPDFTTIDARQVARCIQEGRCAMCGLTLEVDYLEATEVAFIGGPLSIENRNFLDPPMHEACAAYAMQVCPHIAIDTSRYAKPKPEGGLEGRKLIHEVHPDRPERFGMLITTWGAVSTTGYQGAAVFLVSKEADVEVRWQDEPQFDEEGEELVPYWETRHFISEQHESDGEPCLEIEVSTTGRHRKSTKDFLTTLCPGCGTLVALDRVESLNTNKEA